MGSDADAGLRSGKALIGAIGFHDEKASSWSAGYRRSDHFRRRASDWRAVLADYLVPGTRVLDAGCGAGDISLIAARRGVALTCLDGSPAMLAEARTLLSRIDPAPTFEQADVRDMPFASGEFDAIIASSVLEYVDPLDATLAECRRVVRPGGLLICSLPNAKSFYRQAEGVLARTLGRPAYRRHVNEQVYRTDLERAFTLAGFELVERRPFGTPPLLGKGAIGDFAERHPRLATMTLFAVRAS